MLSLVSFFLVSACVSVSSLVSLFLRLSSMISLTCAREYFARGRGSGSGGSARALCPSRKFSTGCR